MPPRVSRALALSAIFLFPIGRAPADTIIERVYVPSSYAVEVPTYTTTSATGYVPSSYTTTAAVLRSTTYTLSPTAYVVPTSTSYVVPTTSVVRTSYVTPTSYVLPTTYVVPTSYVVPTAYVAPTSYVVPTTYVAPTSYVSTVSLVPTSVTALLATSAESPLCCDSSPVVATVATEPCETGTRTVIEAPAVDARRSEPASTPSGAVKSGPSDPVTNPDADDSKEDEPPSLDPKALQPAPRTQPNPPTPPPAPAASEIPAPLTDVPPPSVPLIEPTTPEVPLNDVPPAAAAPAPAPVPATPPQDAAPAVKPPNPAPPAGTPGSAATADHSAMRPVLESAAQPGKTGIGSGTRSLLRGRVVSATTGTPEKGLNVVISSAVGRFRDRTVTTDDDGRFSAVLPEGDWNVRVPVAGSKDDSIWPITVAGGLITDDQDREVATLTINR